MRWDNLTDFLAMGGYASYVWSAFGVTALCLLWEVLTVWRRLGTVSGRILQRRIMDRESS